MGFEIAVQTIVFQELNASSEIGAEVTGIYDQAPEDATFPYITVGESTHNEFDTVDTLGDVATITVHVWSRYRGKKETKEIQALIYNVLHRANVTYSGFRRISIDWENSQTFIDQDGLTRHGVQTFRILIDKE